MIHLVHLSEGKELLRFQHFRGTKTSNKFLNAWGKIISAETLLDENMWVDHLAVVCVVFCHFPKCVMVHIRIKGEVGAVKLV